MQETEIGSGRHQHEQKRAPVLDQFDCLAEFAVARVHGTQLPDLLRLLCCHHMKRRQSRLISNMSGTIRLEDRRVLPAKIMLAAEVRHVPIVRYMSSSRAAAASAGHVVGDVVPVDVRVVSEVMPLSEDFFASGCRARRVSC